MIFEKNDIVIVNGYFNSVCFENKKGRVVDILNHINTTALYIEFDKPFDCGWGCLGRCKPNRGYIFYGDDFINNKIKLYNDNYIMF